MSKLEVIISALLTLSLAINVGLFVYARMAISQLLSVADELSDLDEMIRGFSNHLQTVYELDSFYGDETLHGLLEHAKSFNDYMNTFEFIYSLSEEELQNDNKTDTQNQETEETY
jgi:amino acid permease